MKKVWEIEKYHVIDHVMMIMIATKIVITTCNTVSTRMAMTVTMTVTMPVTKAMTLAMTSKVTLKSQFTICLSKNYLLAKNLLEQRQKSALTLTIYLLNCFNNSTH